MNESKGKSKGSPGKWRRRLPAACVLCAVAAGLCLYLSAAWDLRHEINGDLAIVQLMVRDIIRGAGYPVFFYGQAYMGSLEPFANALAYSCFGRTPFALQMGTLAFALLAFLFTARMARRAGGGWSVAAAMAFCAFAPVAFVHYSVSPRGGYGVLFFCTAALLDLGTSIVIRARARETEPGKPFSVPAVFALGLVAGIAFWCNQLAAPAAAAAGLGIVVFAPRLLARPLFWLSGLLGFSIGSAPFWIWNLRNGMQSFQMAESLAFDYLDILRNARSLVLDRWPPLFSSADAPAWWRRAVFLASVLPVPLAFLSLRPPSRRARRQERPESPAASPGAETQTWLLLFYLAFFTLCFVCSAFAALNTPRYLLPVVPVLAVFFGAGCASKRFRAVQVASVLSLLLVVAGRLGNRRDFRILSSRFEPQYRRAEIVVPFLREANVKAAYTHFIFNSFNLVANDGDIVFSDPKRERVPEFRLALERDDSPAVIENYMGAATWARTSGGTVCETNLCGLRIGLGIRPPREKILEIPPSLWLSATNSAGTDVAGLLKDRSACPAVYLSRDDVFSVRLKEPATLSAVRLYAEAPLFLDGFALFGRTAPDAPYRRLTPLVPETGFAWSGTRLYDYNNALVREARFPPEKLESVQIRFATNHGSPGNGVFELQLLGPAPSPSEAPPSCRDSLPSLVGLLRRQGVRRLYAERWTANNVSAATGDEIWTNWGGLGTPGKAEGIGIVLDPFTAVLMDDAGVPSLREAFASHGVLTREIPVKPFGVLFLPETNQRIPVETKIRTGVDFHEKYAIARPDNDWVRQVLASSHGLPSGDELRDLYRQAPESVPLLRAILAAAPGEGIEELVRQKLLLLTTPSIGKDFPVRFKGGVTWHGARTLETDGRDVGSDGPRPLVLRNYWSAPLSADTDHLRLVYELVAREPGGTSVRARLPFNTTGVTSDTIDDGTRTWHQDVLLPFSPESPRGSYSLSFDLHDAVFPVRRLPLKTDLPSSHQTVVIDDAILFPPDPGL